MTIRKMMAGSALAVGLGVAAMIGAGTADARPGISFDRGSGDPVQFGDNDPKTGAVASASDGNRALAISLYKPATATANGEGTGNRVVAINGAKPRSQATPAATRWSPSVARLRSPSRTTTIRSWPSAAMSTPPTRALSASWHCAESQLSGPRATTSRSAPGPAVRPPTRPGGRRGAFFGGSPFCAACSRVALRLDAARSLWLDKSGANG